MYSNCKSYRESRVRLVKRRRNRCHTLRKIVDSYGNSKEECSTAHMLSPGKLTGSLHPIQLSNIMHLVRILIFGYKPVNKACQGHAPKKSPQKPPLCTGIADKQT